MYTSEKKFTLNDSLGLSQAGLIVQRTEQSSLAFSVIKRKTDRLTKELSYNCAQTVFSYFNFYLH